MIAGKRVDRVPAGPLAVHFCAGEKGVSLQRYSSDAKTLADCVIAYGRKYEPDAVWISADTWVTAEAMGAETRFSSPDQPKGGTGNPLVRSLADLDAIPSPDPAGAGRIPMMLEAVRRVREGLGEDVFIVGCFDQQPFSLACSLMGINELMMALVDQPVLVERLLERCRDHCIAYATALAKAGSDMLSTGDSPAGLIGPKRYRELALPSSKEVFRRIREEVDVPLSLHICGDATPILDDMVASGADVLEVDHRVDLKEVIRITRNRVALWGNIDPVGVLERGTPESVTAACDAAMDAAEGCRFILSSGCTLSVGTPEENLRAMISSCRNRQDGVLKESNPGS